MKKNIEYQTWVKNIHYVNTDRLSEDINNIYDKYQELKQLQNEESLGK